MAAEKKLSDRQIKNAPPGKLYDGGGLICRKSESSIKWVYRFSLNKKQHDMGLGTYPQVTLAEARLLRDENRKLLANGLNPIHERDRANSQAQEYDHTFASLLSLTFEAKKAELKEDGKAGRWLSPLSIHVLPKLGHRNVESLNQMDFHNLVKPLWHTKHETARKALNRIGIVLKYAAAMGLDVNLNAVPLAKELLGKSNHQPQSVPALHWKDVPEFYQSLDQASPTHFALRLLILTASRTKPIRFMQLSQINEDLWTVPAENMKGRKGKTSDFRIPLSAEAQKVIELAKSFERGGYLFPGIRKGVISDATMERHMERRGLTARPHGFRSSLETWLADCTDVSYEEQRAMLGHSIGDAVYRAYQRSDLLQRRRETAERWANFVTGQTSYP